MKVSRSRNASPGCYPRLLGRPLVVVATAEDSFAVRLRDTLHPEDYVLIRACSRAEILEAVERAGTSVVILDHDLREVDWRGLVTVDRKSTRLNSSHVK